MNTHIRNRLTSKRPLLLVLFLCACGYMAAAQTGSQYVWAPSGLLLRNAAQKTGVVLQKLPFGKKVTVLKNTGVADSVKELSHFYITGTWLQVATEKDTGFIFGGYLDTYKPTPFSYLEYEKYPAGKFEKFLYTHFKPAAPMKVLEYGNKEDCPDQNPRCLKTYEIDFRGIRYHYRQFGESGATNTQITFPKMPMQRIYLWALYRLGEDGPVTHQITYENGSLIFDTHEAGCWLNLRYDGHGNMVWEEGCSC